MQTLKKVGLGIAGISVIAISAVTLTGCFGVSSDDASIPYKTAVTIGSGGNNPFNGYGLEYNSEGNSKLLDSTGKVVNIDSDKYNSIIQKDINKQSTEEKSEIATIATQQNAFNITNSLGQNLTNQLSSLILFYMTSDLESDQGSFNGFNDFLKTQSTNDAKILNEFAFAYHLSGGIGSKTYQLSPIKLDYKVDVTDVDQTSQITDGIKPGTHVPDVAKDQETPLYRQKMSITDINITYAWHKVGNGSLTKLDNDDLPKLQKEIVATNFWKNNVGYDGSKVTQPTVINYDIKFANIDYLLEYAQGSLDVDGKKQQIFTGLINFATWPKENGADDVINSSFKFSELPNNALQAQDTRIIFEHLTDFKDSLKESKEEKTKIANEIKKVTPDLTFYSQILGY